MVRARVLRAYIDKKTKQTHKVNEVIDLKEDRFEFLKQHGFVVEDSTNQEAQLEALKAENTKLKAEIEKLKSEAQAQAEAKKEAKNVAIEPKK